MERALLIGKLLENFNSQNSLESKNDSGISEGEVDAIDWERKFYQKQIEQMQKSCPWQFYIG